MARARPAPARGARTGEPLFECEESPGLAIVRVCERRERERARRRRGDGREKICMR